MDGQIAAGDAQQWLEWVKGREILGTPSLAGGRDIRSLDACGDGRLEWSVRVRRQPRLRSAPGQHESGTTAARHTPATPQPEARPSRKTVRQAGDLLISGHHWRRSCTNVITGVFRCEPWSGTTEDGHKSWQSARLGIMLSIQEQEIRIAAKDF